MKPTKEQLEKLAEWWAHKIFDVPLNQDNGDTEHPLTFILMNTISLRAKDKVRAEDRDIFKDVLVKRLMEEEGRLDLDVDYHPNHLLFDICSAANIDPAMLPCKTFTYWDHNNKIFKGKFKYGGQFGMIC